MLKHFFLKSSICVCTWIQPQNNRSSSNVMIFTVGSPHKMTTHTHSTQNPFWLDAISVVYFGRWFFPEHTSIEIQQSFNSSPNEMQKFHRNKGFGAVNHKHRVINHYVCMNHARCTKRNDFFFWFFVRVITISSFQFYWTFQMLHRISTPAMNL